MKHQKLEHPTDTLFHPLTAEQGKKIVGGYLPTRTTGRAPTYDDHYNIIDTCTDRNTIGAKYL